MKTYKSILSAIVLTSTIALGSVNVRAGAINLPAQQKMAADTGKMKKDKMKMEKKKMAKMKKEKMTKMGKDTMSKM